MSENRTVVYTPEAGCGCGSGGGMMAMLAPLLQQKGIDPNLLMALNGKNNNGFGGDGSWFLIYSITSYSFIISTVYTFLSYNIIYHPFNRYITIRKTHFFIFMFICGNHF